jgi:5'-nucleotidase
MNRKQFLTLCLQLGAAAPLAAKPILSALANQETKPSHSSLVLLHTNDMHSRILPFPEHHPKHPSKGGMLAIAGKVKTLQSAHPHALLLDCGDFLQGTPFFNEYGGEVEVSLMNSMGYHYVTLGNHEFDNGELALAKLLQKANFKTICCNYQFTNSPLQGLVSTEPVIHELHVHHRTVKIGIIGVGVNLEGLANPNHCKGVRYLEPAPIIQAHAASLRSKGCSKVIVLSHLGFPHDKQVAANTHGVDVMLGGHSHTLLEEPVTVLNQIGKPVLINQVYRDALYLGQVTLPL